MFNKTLVLVAVCALALTACPKKKDKKADGKEKPAAAMDGKQDAKQDAKKDAKKDVKKDVKKDAPKGTVDAKKLAQQVLKMQAEISDVMVKALPDCDKAAKVAIAVLDKPENKKLAVTVKANAAAVKTAQSALLKADKANGAFIRGRMKVMIKCKGNAKHKTLHTRLAAMWK